MSVNFGFQTVGINCVINQSDKLPIWEWNLAARCVSNFRLKLTNHSRFGELVVFRRGWVWQIIVCTTKRYPNLHTNELQYRIVYHNYTRGMKIGWWKKEKSCRRMWTAYVYIWITGTTRRNWSCSVNEQTISHRQLSVERKCSKLNPTWWFLLGLA